MLVAFVLVVIYKSSKCRISELNAFKLSDCHFATPCRCLWKTLLKTWFMMPVRLKYSVFIKVRYQSVTQIRLAACLAYLHCTRHVLLSRMTKQWFRSVWNIFDPSRIRDAIRLIWFQLELSVIITTQQTT